MSDERTPLLPLHRSDHPPPLPLKPPSPTGVFPVPPSPGPERPHIHLEPPHSSTALSLPALARVAAAIQAGHLPATSQLLALCDTTLQSSLLDDADEPLGVGRLSREGEQVRLATREAIWSFRELVEGRNPVVRTQKLDKDAELVGETDQGEAGNGWQEFIWRCKGSEVDFHGPSASLPHPTKSDTAQTRASLLTLLQLFLTSPDLRSLLSDAVLLLRDATDAIIETVEKKDHLINHGTAAALEQVVEGLTEKAVGEDKVREYEAGGGGLSYAAIAAKAPLSPPQETEKVEIEVGVEVAKSPFGDPPEVQVDVQATLPGKGEEEEEEDAGAEDPAEEAVPPVPPQKSAEQIKDAFVDRLKEILLHLQSTPSYQRSTSTLLSLARNYISHTLTTIVPAVSVHPPTPPKTPSTPSPEDLAQDRSDPIELLIPLLEPFTGGAGSLHPLREAALDLLSHLSSSSQSPFADPDSAKSASQDNGGQENHLLASSLTTLGTQLDTLISRTFLIPGWIGSSESYRMLGGFYDSLNQLSSTFPIARDSLSNFLSLLIDVLQGVASDPLLGRTVLAVEELGKAMAGWVEAVGETAARLAIGDGIGAVGGDLIEWVLPRVLGILKEVPMPRLEFSSPALDLAIDPPSLLSTSFIPSSLTLRQATSLTYIPTLGSTSLALPPSSSTSAPPSLSAAPASARTRYAASTNIQIDGLRMEIKNVGYFARYHTGLPCIGDITESGLLDLSFGSPSQAKGGLSLSLSTSSTSSTSSSSPLDQTLFHITPSETQAKLSNFTLKAHQSSHPFLLYLFRPLLRKSVQKIVEYEARQVLLLQGGAWVGRKGWEVREVARRIEREVEAQGTKEKMGEGKGSGGAWKWVRAGWEVFTRSASSPSTQEVEEGGDTGVDVNAKAALAPLTSSDAPLPESPTKIDYHPHLNEHGFSLDLERGPAPAPPTEVAISSSPEGRPEEEEEPESIGTVGFGTEGVVIPLGQASIPLPEGQEAPKGLVKAAREEVDRDVAEGRRAVGKVAGVMGEVGEAGEEWTQGRRDEERKTGWRSEAFDLK
ncbi:hypothetical protein JCM11641_006902 [Rhodosporidiobolus odoratus]